MRKACRSVLFFVEEMETTVPICCWLNHGYSQHYAEAMEGLQLSIIESTINMRLKLMTQESNNVLVVEDLHQHPKLMTKSTLLMYS